MITTLLSLLFILQVQIAHLQPIQPPVRVMASHEFSLQNRYGNTFVNDIFRDNILLTIRYAVGEKLDPNKIDWKKIDQPFQSKLVLRPGETFAFHDDVLSQYEDKIVKTTNAHFSSNEGFKSDGYLVGDGVCHLASLLYWVAKDAGLEAWAPTRHDFAPVPEVPQKFGVSIYSNPDKSAPNESQNLYISNTKNKTIAFVFNYDGRNLSIKAIH